MSIPIRSLEPVPLTVGQTTVAPGSRARTQLDLIELADGAKVRLPVGAINGAGPGPRIYLGAAIHGDEVNGIAIPAEALTGIDPARRSVAHRGRAGLQERREPIALLVDAKDDAAAAFYRRYGLAPFARNRCILFLPPATAARLPDGV